MLKEHTPVWVWDGYWWSAYVVLPELDVGSDMMLVRFENGGTAPVKASDVRYRDSARSGECSTYQTPIPMQRRSGAVTLPDRAASANAPTQPLCPFASRSVFATAR